MMISENADYQSELGLVSNQVPVDALKGSRVLITGASGLVGSAIVDLLLHLNRVYHAQIDIVAVGRSMEKLVCRFGECDFLSFAQYEDVLGGKVVNDCSHFVLAASPASPEIYVNDPDSVIKANTDDIRSIITGIKCPCGKSVVYISSSEVYGNLAAPACGYGEDEFGMIDSSSRRSCYALSKRKAEQMCRDFAAELGLRVMLVRPGHVYGPTATQSDRRVSSAWAYDVAAGRDIVMKSDGRQLRSYVHCLDCAAAVLVVLCRGKSCEAYNISNRDSVITIREMAEFLVKAGGVQLRLDIPSDVDRQAFNPMSNSSLDSRKLEALGWEGVIDAKTGFAKTVQIIRAIGENRQ